MGFFSPQRGQNFYAQGLIRAEDAEAGHSFNPAYIRHQALQKLEELARPFLDLLFLHNPEREFALETLEKARQKIHEALEEFATQGLIKGYGIATWLAFEEKGTSTFTLSELLEIA